MSQGDAATSGSTAHDQLFKTLLESFFEDFLRLVVPEHAQRLRTSEAEFLRQEHFTDLPEGDYRALDILAKIPTIMHAPELVLVHVEVEGEFRNQFPKRMWRYYMQLLLRHDLPVLPIVLFLEGGPKGVIKSEHQELFLGQKINQFTYFSFGLSGERAEAYLSRPEPLSAALAALMRFERGERALHKLECMRKVADAKVNKAKRFLLWNCVQTYLKLEKEEQKTYTALLEKEPKSGVKKMETTYADELILKGRAEGRAEAILELLEGRGIALTEQQRQIVRVCTNSEQLRAWLLGAATVNKAEDLFKKPAKATSQASSSKKSPKKPR